VGSAASTKCLALLYAAPVAELESVAANYIFAVESLAYCQAVKVADSAGLFW
jgi:hypothetical protein